MIRLFPLLGIQLLFILALSWGLPALYDMALVKPIARTHIFYSPTLERFIYTEQIRGHDEQAAAKSEGHHADIVYKDEDGTYYDRLAFEEALPFIYFRNMEMRGLLPLHLEGKVLDRKAIEKARRVLELRAGDIDGQRPPRELLPLIEAEPGQAALLYPVDRFRLTDSRLEFVNADTNAVDEELSVLFSDALSARGFRFPAVHAGGNFTTFKPYEGGIFLVDVEGKLFHLLRRKNAPEVTPVPLPAGVRPRHILVSESRERLWLGLMADARGGLWLIRQKDMALMPLEVPGYAPAQTDAKLIFDPLYLTVAVSDVSHVHVSAYRLPDRMVEAGAGALKPFRTFTHHMSRARESWQQTVADTVFPFRLSFTSENSAYAAPELTFSPRIWSHALPMSLLLAFAYTALVMRRERRPLVRCLDEAVLIGVTGVFGLLTLLLLREHKG